MEPSAKWPVGLADFNSKIQLVVYNQCCILSGWATTRLYVITYSPLVAKSTGFENQNNGAELCFTS